MYFGKTTMAGLAASQSTVTAGTGLLATWFPQYATQIQQSAAAVYGTPAAQAQAQQAAAAAAAGNTGMTTEKIMLYGGIGLGVIALAFVLLRRS